MIAIHIQAVCISSFYYLTFILPLPYLSDRIVKEQLNILLNVFACFPKMARAVVRD